MAWPKTGWSNFSGCSDHDFEAAQSAEVPPDQLDYAVLRLAKRAGDDPIGGPQPYSGPRGWIEAPQAEHDFKKNPAINIVQHPSGRPMQIAVSSKAVVDSALTRVR
jgi:hypothetical protein